MLDIKVIRDNPDKVKQACINKNDKADIDAIIELDNQRKKLLTETESLRAEQNKASQEIGKVKKAGGDASEAIAAMKAVSDKAAELTGKVREVEEQLTAAMVKVPNIPDDDVPVGPDEEHNVTIREWGTNPEFSFKPAPHWEIAEKLDIIDLPRGAAVSGSGFYVLKGMGARLERALISFMIDFHTREYNYTEIAPPFVCRSASMQGTGQLPKLEDDMYRIEGEDLYLIPTGEVPVTNLHREEIMTEADLPKYYTCLTPCFRREAGAAGKDTRGILRVHQFNKVEMVKIVKPEDSDDEHEKLVDQAEQLLQVLKVPYRVSLLATGDLSFAAAKCYDIEIWSAGVANYLEVSSISNFRDFQARRMNCRYRDENKKVQFVHTLNGSGTALPRLMIALIENNQTETGEVIIPEALVPYMDGLEKIS